MIRTFSALLLALALLCAALPTVATAGRGDWWMFRHDPQHTGRSAVSGPSIPVPKWVFAPDFGYMRSSPAIGADGTLYIGSRYSKLYAVNQNGTKKWAFTTISGSWSGEIIWSSPALGTDGTIYIGANNCHLYAVNPDGTQKWAFQTGVGELIDDTESSSPAIGADGTVYLDAPDYKLYAINPNGTQKWAFTTGYEIYASPAIGADGTIYVLSGDGKLYAITSNGTQKWAFDTGSIYPMSSPAIGADGTIYAVSDKLYAINPNGTEKWVYATGGGMSSPAIGADGTIYVGSDKLYAINPNGTKKWAYATGDYINSSPAIGADGKIYVGSNDRNLYAINPDGTQKWVIATGGPIASSPAIGADGTVYVGSDDKKLYAIGNKAATFTVTPTAGINGTISPNTPQTVTANGNLTLTATANAGYTVDAWQLDTITVQTGGLTYMLKNVTANHTVKVTFKPLTVTLTPSTDANGTITPNTAQTANYGNSVTFTAKPNAGYQVDYWKCNGAIVFNGGKVANGAYTGLTFTIIPISSSTVNVAFTAVNYTITPSAGANGAISTNIPQLAKYGCKLIFTAKPNTGYRVDYWKFNGALVYNAGKAANGAYTGSTLTLTVISNSTVYVAFTAMNYTITPSAGPNGSIIPKSTQTVSNGSSVSFTATANAGYTVDSWTLDGAVVQTGGNQYTLKTIFANHAVKVTFKLRTFLITPSGGSGGVITPPTPQMVNYAGNITFIATAYAGFTVDCWTLDGVTIQVGGSSYTLKTVTFAHTVMVKFISTNKNQPDLTICNNGDTTYMGWNILNVTGSNQTTMQSVANGVAATYLWRVENHGYTSDSFLLTCPLPALSGWTVQVIDRVTNKDITAAITGAGYTSVTLAPGVAGGFTLKVTLTSTALSGKAYALLITGVSVKDNTKKDAVKAVTTKQ